ncbi:hypothetical protein DPMN_103067 [Dreissena polymorpha]|uniref:HAT C-terminal dimerisation domain-containing protein n=1 Tax=Dreissena polymorpha TaxID=45954 RepID=A0A9D4H779_DREPO|nr:hypothetical protein DPMN_103067 [Dreissena polymorpha]
MCIIPTSTAVVERGFSTMNLLCSPLRSTFTQTKLTHLMLTCIEDLYLNDKTLEELCDAFKKQKAEKKFAVTCVTKQCLFWYNISAISF